MDDLEYLRAKGVFQLPSPAMRYKLLEGYFNLVHPCLPILDRAAILDSVQMTNGSSKISLLLFRCIMLSARLFLDAYEGRRTRPATIRVMFDHARVLYDLGWETDRLTMLQSLLLMTLHTQPIDTPKGSLSLISQATSLAYVLGLHRDPVTVTHDTRERSLRKRTWWSLYIRERFIVLDHGSPWMIGEQDHEVPMLVLDDFVRDPLWPSLDTREIFAQHHDASQQRKLALMFIERAKLATLIGQLSPISLRPYSTSNGVFESNCAKIQQGPPVSTNLGKTGRDLDRFVANMPLELVYIETHGFKAAGSLRENVLSFHYTALMLLYHIATNHWAGLRWLEMSAMTADVSEAAVRTLWAATRPIINLVDGLMKEQSAAYCQLITPSLIRPLLLCEMLNRDVPFWLTPSLDPSPIPALFARVGGADVYFARGACYNQQTSTRSPIHVSPTPSREGPDLLASPTTSTPLFDDILTDFPSTMHSMISQVPLADEILFALDGGTLC